MKRRPLTAEKLIKLEEVREYARVNNKRIDVACDECGVWVTTYYNWLKAARANRQLHAGPQTVVTIYTANDQRAF